MAAHRYWRINFTGITNPGSSFAIAEIKMCTALAGATVTTGGTASVQSIFSGSATYNADKANDGNATTFWHSASGTVPQWYKYDFGAGNDKDIIEVALVAPTSREHQMPTSFTVQYSDDNATWTDAWSVADTKYRYSSNQTGQPEYRWTNPAVGGKTYWRINVTNTDSSADSFGLAELGFATSVSGSNVATGGVGGANTEFNTSTFKATNMFDGNNTSYYSAKGTLAQAVTAGYPTAAYYHWSSAQNIVEVIIRNRADGTLANEGRQAPEAFDLQSSPDGETWTTEWSKSGIVWSTQGETQRFNNGGSAAAPRRTVWSEAA